MGLAPDLTALALIGMVLLMALALTIITQALALTMAPTMILMAHGVVIVGRAQMVVASVINSDLAS